MTGAGDVLTRETHGVVEIPTFQAFCTDGCGGIITDGWCSRPFADKAAAERALREHRGSEHR